MAHPSTPERSISMESEAVPHPSQPHREGAGTPHTPHIAHNCPAASSSAANVASGITSVSGLSRNGTAP